MKYIIIYAESFSDKIMVVNELETYDNQNRMSFFNEFYSDINNYEYLPLLIQKELDFLIKRASVFLQPDYRKKVTKHVSERHHKVVKSFLGKDYELFVIEDRLAILGIDLYNINIYAKLNNLPIQFKTFETKREMLVLNN